MTVAVGFNPRQRFHPCARRRSRRAEVFHQPRPRYLHPILHLRVSNLASIIAVRSRFFLDASHRVKSTGARNLTHKKGAALRPLLSTLYTLPISFLAVPTAAS